MSASLCPGSGCRDPFSATSPKILFSFGGIDKDIPRNPLIHSQKKIEFDTKLEKNKGDILKGLYCHSAHFSRLIYVYYILGVFVLAINTN